MKKILILSGLVSGLALSGCATVSPVVSQDMQNALATACPIIALVQADTAIKLNTYQKAALTSLELACPPNPPPTSSLIIAGDILSAYAILQPLTAKH